MIDLVVPFTDDDLLQRIHMTRAAASLGEHEAYIRVLLTRGIGELTYDLRATPTPSGRCFAIRICSAQTKRS